MHYLDLTQARAVYQILADGRYIWASTAEYVRRDPGMSGFPQRSFGKIPPVYVW